MTNVKLKKPTNKDVARLAGVSVATVSYVINGRKDQKISEETKNKVLHAVNFLGYVPNLHAVAMKASVKSIVIRTSKHNGFLQDAEALLFAKELTELCKDGEYTVTLSAETEPSRGSATACVCIGMTDEEFHDCAKENFIPFISVDTILNDPFFYQITTDYEKIKADAETKFGQDYAFVTLKPNDTSLEREILSAFPKVVFIDKLDDLKNLEDKRVVFGNLIFSELSVDERYRTVEKFKSKLKTILECVNKAVSRENVSDESHYIKV